MSLPRATTESHSDDPGDRERRNFYVTGGTLAPGTPSYVPRQADRELDAALVAGEFCYVLTSRQMGKSSLMVRTAMGLRARNSRVAVIDLTAIGNNVSVDQWYHGLLSRLGSQLGVDAAIDDWLDAYPTFSPVSRWLLAFEKVILPTLEGQVVIFVDEIDLVRSLPFPADEFFAALRHGFNRRSEDPAWRRVTFCLLGVATPSDLISNPQITPFNVGRRIELHDFLPEEAAMLADGLHARPELARRLLDRVMHWTDGHPYLTQRLCSAVARAPDVRAAGDVDRVCGEEFLSTGAQERDDNLLFVRERLLNSEVDRAEILDLYGRIRRGLHVEDEHTPACEVLKLSGIVRSRQGELQIRNRIYAHVFGAEWVRRHMPGAELRRQRAAFYRGLARAAAVASIVVSILVAVSSFAFYQWWRATEALKLAEANQSGAQIEHRRATAAAEEAREAFAREQQQRQLAEQRKREAEELGKLAETRRAAAEANYQEAMENYRRMQLAHQRLLDEQRSVEERGKLFLAIPAWLQSFSTEAVGRYAQEQVKQGDPLQALQTYAEFCKLALGDDQGFWASELVRIDPDELKRLNLDAAALDTRILVQPADVMKHVILPAIHIAEQKVTSADAQADVATSLATLYGSQARLMFQYPELASQADDRYDKIVALYDQAITLDTTRPGFYMGRAVARFYAESDQLEAVQADLQAAIDHYPVRVSAPGDPSDVSQAHRDQALIHQSLGNLAEIQAEKGARSARAASLESAVHQHQQARELHPSNPRHSIYLARALRKQSQLAQPPDTVLLNESRTLLDSTRTATGDEAELWNELGETQLVLGEVNAARESFDAAVRANKQIEFPGRHYRYLCNQANAYIRPPTSAADLRRALVATEAALAIQPDRGAEGLYFSGLALWTLTKFTDDESERSQYKSRSLEQFEAALRQHPRHVDALLARAQWMLENPEPLDESRFEPLMQDIRQAASLSRSPAQLAKAQYVLGLGHLRDFLDRRRELSLVESLRAMLAAAQASPDYVPLVADYFSQANKRPWTDKSLKAQAQTLTSAYEAITR